MICVPDELESRKCGYAAAGEQCQELRLPTLC